MDICAIAWTSGLTYHPSMDLVVRNSIMTMSDHLPKHLVRQDPYYEEVRLRNVVVPQDQTMAARMVATTLVREL